MYTKQDGQSGSEEKGEKERTGVSGSHGRGRPQHFTVYTVIFSISYFVVVTGLWVGKKRNLMSLLLLFNEKSEAQTD